MSEDEPVGTMTVTATKHAGEGTATTHSTSSGDLHASVSNRLAIKQTESSFDTGIESGEGAIESVPGYDESLALQESGQGLESPESSFVLDAEYAMGDPTSGLLIQKQLQEVVIGTDDRVQITSTTATPWRLICSLLITAADGSKWIGTGWLAGRRTVITAGHCVHIKNRGGWVRSIVVIPGRSGASKPYGSVTSSEFRSVVGWTQNADRNYDYGAIILPPQSPLGTKLGYFGFADTTSMDLVGKMVNLSGYPGDKPAGTQWFHARKIESVTDRVITYLIDTAGGQSGAPVWRYFKGTRQRLAVAIHTNGHPMGNSATRINAPVYRNLQSWRSV